MMNVNSPRIKTINIREFDMGILVNIDTSVTFTDIYVLKNDELYKIKKQTQQELTKCNT